MLCKCRVGLCCVEVSGVDSAIVFDIVLIVSDALGPVLLEPRGAWEGRVGGLGRVSETTLKTNVFQEGPGVALGTLAAPSGDLRLNFRRL